MSRIDEEEEQRAGSSADEDYKYEDAEAEEDDDDDSENEDIYLEEEGAEESRPTERVTRLTCAAAAEEAAASAEINEDDEDLRQAIDLSRSVDKSVGLPVPVHKPKIPVVRQSAQIARPVPAVQHIESEHSMRQYFEAAAKYAVQGVQSDKQNVEEVDALLARVAEEGVDAHLQPPSLADLYRWRTVPHRWALGHQTHGVGQKDSQMEVNVYVVIDTDQHPLHLAITPDIVYLLTTNRMTRTCSHNSVAQCFQCADHSCAYMCLPVSFSFSSVAVDILNHAQSFDSYMRAVSGTSLFSGASAEVNDLHPHFVPVPPQVQRDKFAAKATRGTPIRPVFTFDGAVAFMLRIASIGWTKKSVKEDERQLRHNLFADTERQGVQPGVYQLATEFFEHVFGVPGEGCILAKMGMGASHSHARWVALGHRRRGGRHNGWAETRSCSCSHRIARWS